MIPGNTITKDPTVTVEAGSEDCWLFVKVVESDNLDTFIDYKIAEGWTALDGHAGVYYREVATTESDKVFKVLAGDEVTVNNTVKKDYAKFYLRSIVEASSSGSGNLNKVKAFEADKLKTYFSKCFWRKE